MASGLAVVWSPYSVIPIQDSTFVQANVLAAVDEAAPPVIVLRVCDSLCDTLGLSLCGRPVCIRDVVRVNI